VLKVGHALGSRSRRIRSVNFSSSPIAAFKDPLRSTSIEGGQVRVSKSKEELIGALVIIDTAMRFTKGDENSSEDMRLFAEECFRLMKEGASSILVLFHSGKGTKESSELILENSMRGCGELGAFVSSCWATRLQDPEEPYKSASYLKNVKQRNFESKPFEVTCGPSRAF
jgi:hypothetical protein